MSTAEAELRAIADIVKQAAGPGVGFALFLGPGGYISNANRADVKKTLGEWLLRVQEVAAPLSSSEGTERYGYGAKGEDPRQREKRLALEARCAEIGKVIASVSGVLIFLFDFGEGGHLAYFTNIGDPRPAIRRWIES